jgi:hypothetical protein
MRLPLLIEGGWVTQPFVWRTVGEMLQGMHVGSVEPSAAVCVFGTSFGFHISSHLIGCLDVVLVGSQRENSIQYNKDVGS